METGFNPRAAVEQLRGRVLIRGGRECFEPPESYFLGNWVNRHPLNTPGPFYGAETYTSCEGPHYAPQSLLYDEDGAGFVWRQPSDDTQTHALMTGASSDLLSGYSQDGNDRWTPVLVRNWWAERTSHQPSIDQLVALANSPIPQHQTRHESLPVHAPPIGGVSASDRAKFENILQAYLTYRESNMAHDLRRYLFFLEEGQYPASDDHLPELGV